MKDRLKPNDTGEGFNTWLRKRFELLDDSLMYWLKTGKVIHPDENVPVERRRDRVERLVREGVDGDSIQSISATAAPAEPAEPDVDEVSGDEPLPEFTVTKLIPLLAPHQRPVRVVVGRNYKKNGELMATIYCPTDDGSWAPEEFKVGELVKKFTVIPTAERAIEPTQIAKALYPPEERFNPGQQGNVVRATIQRQSNPYLRIGALIKSYISGDEKSENESPMKDGEESYA